MKKGTRLNILPGSNIYIDTNDPDYVLELSLCKTHLRVIPLNGGEPSYWIDRSTTTIRHSKDCDSIHYRKQRKYPVMLKFDKLPI